MISNRVSKNRRRSKALFQDLGRELFKIRNYFGLTKRELAQTINVGEKTIFRWEKGESIPSNLALERLELLYNLCKEISGLFGENVDEWLYSENSLLKREKPITMLLLGQLNELYALVIALKEGVYQ